MPEILGRTWEGAAHDYSWCYTQSSTTQAPLCFLYKVGLVEQGVVHGVITRFILGRVSLSSPPAIEFYDKDNKASHLPGCL